MLVEDPNIIAITSQPGSTQYQRDAYAEQQQQLFEEVIALLGHSRQARESAAANRKPWVLVIDDDPAFLNVATMQLQKKGFGVFRADEGMRGLAAAYHKPAGVIILDLNLPNGSGEYVLGRLKSEPLTRQIPVIVVTGDRERSIKEEILSMGACDFLLKPLDFEELCSAIQLHFDPVKTNSAV